MKKSVMALLISSMGMCAFAQTHPASMGALLAPKPHRFSMQLLRASGTCGPVADCSYSDSDRAYGVPISPCVSSPFGCYLASSRGEWESSRYIGGARFSADVGGMSLSGGRHRDNLILGQATFMEGSRRMGPGFFSAGVLTANHVHALAYVVYRMTF